MHAAFTHADDEDSVGFAHVDDSVFEMHANPKVA